MDKLSLNGRWQYERKGGGESGIATVPGDIYMDLLNNKQIPDPFYRDNEEYLQWIGDSEWSFQRTFTIVSLWSVLRTSAELWSSARRSPRS